MPSGNYDVNPYYQGPYFILTLNLHQMMKQVYNVSIDGHNISTFKRKANQKMSLQCVCRIQNPMLHNRPNLASLVRSGFQESAN